MNFDSLSRENISSRRGIKDDSISSSSFSSSSHVLPRTAPNSHSHPHPPSNLPRSPRVGTSKRAQTNHSSISSSITPSTSTINPSSASSSTSPYPNSSTSFFPSASPIPRPPPRPLPSSAVRSNRSETKALGDRTHMKLAELYQKEQTGIISSIERHTSQVQILDDSMRQLRDQVKIHCTEQADLLWKIWSSSSDLYSSVYEDMSERIRDLQLHLQERSKAAEYWEKKAKDLRKSRLFPENDNTKGKELEIHIELRKKEEELYNKDKELSLLYSKLNNLSLWFPLFNQYGDSVLKRFLPPIDYQSNPELPINNAQDALLSDLKRLEKLDIGLEVQLVQTEDRFNAAEIASFSFATKVSRILNIKNNDESDSSEDDEVDEASSDEIEEENQQEVKKLAEDNEQNIIEKEIGKPKEIVSRRKSIAMLSNQKEILNFHSYYQKRVKESLQIAQDCEASLAEKNQEMKNLNLKHALELKKCAEREKQLRDKLDHVLGIAKRMKDSLPKNFLPPLSITSTSYSSRWINGDHYASLTLPSSSFSSTLSIDDIECIIIKFAHYFSSTLIEKPSSDPIYMNKDQIVEWKEFNINNLFSGQSVQVATLSPLIIHLEGDRELHSYFAHHFFMYLYDQSHSKPGFMISQIVSTIIQWIKEGNCSKRGEILAHFFGIEIVRPNQDVLEYQQQLIYRSEERIRDQELIQNQLKEQEDKIKEIEKKIQLKILKKEELKKERENGGGVEINEVEDIDEEDLNPILEAAYNEYEKYKKEIQDENFKDKLKEEEQQQNEEIKRKNEREMYHLELQYKELASTFNWKTLDIDDQHIYFDFLSICFKTCRAFSSSFSSFTSSNGKLIPILWIPKLIKRIFVIYNDKKDEFESENNDTNELDLIEEILEEQNNSLIILPWWRYSLQPFIDKLIVEINSGAILVKPTKNSKDINEDIASFSNNEDSLNIKEDLLEEISESLAKSTLTSSAPSHFSQDSPQMMVDIFHIISCCFNSVKELKQLLLQTLESIYYILNVLVPDGPTNIAYAPLLTSMLSLSPFTHKKMSIDKEISEYKERKENENNRDNLIEELTKNMLLPSIGPSLIDLSLLSSLRTLHTRNNLTASSFSQEILKHSPPQFVQILQPLLLAYKYETSPFYSMEKATQEEKREVQLLNLASTSSTISSSVPSGTGATAILSHLDEKRRKEESFHYHSLLNKLNMLGSAYLSIIEDVLELKDNLFDKLNSRGNFRESVSLYKALHPDEKSPFFPVEKKDEENNNELSSSYSVRVYNLTNYLFSPSLQNVLSSSITKKWFLLISLLTSFSQEHHCFLLSMFEHFSSSASADYNKALIKIIKSGAHPIQLEELDFPLKLKEQKAEYHYKRKSMSKPFNQLCLALNSA